MATYCLVPSEADKFKKALISGKLNPETLSTMTSAQRRSAFAEVISEENTRNVNALFESKLLLKNQQAGYVSWAKKITGITEPVRRDILAKIERLDKALTPVEENAFLEDLVSKRLGIEITYEEAGNIAELAQKVETTKTKIPENSPIRSTERMEYGSAVQNLKDYIDGLKLDAERITLSEFKERPLQTALALIRQGVTEIPGALKSAVASLDNSFFGRQGIKTLYTAPDIWVKAFAKSFQDLGKQIFAKGKWYSSGDNAVEHAVRADILSRPNAINGKYKAGKFDLDIITEEAFPSSLPKRIPVLGRLFKASQVAYNNGALRIRADLADRYIEQAEKFGVDMLDPEQAVSMGKLTNAMTGRGSIGRLGVFGKETNVLLFSVRFLKSNIDTLFQGIKYPITKPLSKIGLYRFENKGAEFAARKAARNLFSMIATMAGILTTAELLYPGSVEKDPRSSNFGKIKIGDTRFDITGGMASLVTLASRITPTQHNGEWGFWTKSGTTGIFTKLNTRKYGASTAWDVALDFAANKLSPVAGIFRDQWRGEMFGGKPATFENQVKGVTTPIIIQNYQELVNNPNAAPILGSMIADFLGISTNTYGLQTDWDNNLGKELQQFKDKIGDDKFQEANDEFNQEVNEWFEWYQLTAEFTELSDEDKGKKITAEKDKIKNRIFKKHGFKYKSD